MKLDKIKFAKLVQYIINLNHQNYLELDVLDDLIDIDVPVANPYCAPATEDIHELMALMAEGKRKIDAIRMHRKLTGYGLKDSKDMVEKYWTSKP